MVYSEKLFDAMREGGASVVGLGVSNLPLIKFLLSRGIRVSGHDRKPLDAASDDVRALGAIGVRLACGEDYLSSLDGAVIFRSPGIRPDIPEFRAAVARGALLSSEMELFLALCPAKIFAITGSDGKTTTTTLTGLLLSEEGGGRVYVGGNIGEPLIGRVDEMTAQDRVVLELSSFQLMTIDRAPDRAVITNITPNHLNWHTGMEEYIEAKKRLLSADNFGIFNADNDVTATIALRHAPKAVFSSTQSLASLDEKFGDCTLLWLEGGRIMLRESGAVREILRTDEILLPGKHNIENYMAAIALTLGDVSTEAIRRVATSFRGVAHRLEHVRRLDGVDYYNSSIDSTPSRTAAALSALTVKPVVICGGYDKKVSFAPLAETLAERAAAVVLTGATADAIYEAIESCESFDREKICVEHALNFEDAVTAARRLARPGGAVLLSPACASFDAFKNFEERGEVFKQIVLSFK